MWWFGIGVLLFYALPVTTPFLAALAAAWFWLRRGPAGWLLPIVKWSALGFAPFWLGGAVCGVAILVTSVTNDIEEARRRTTLTQATEIAGTRFPAGTEITRDESGKQLRFVDLPEGATIKVAGADWRGRVGFIEPNHAPDGVRSMISSGTLATSTTIQNIPCQADYEVNFFRDGTLMGCMLSADTTASAQIRDRDDVVKTEGFRCRAANPIVLQEAQPPGQLEDCILAEPAQIAAIACADSAELRLWDGNLRSCTLAKPARFGPLDLPADSTVVYDNGRLRGLVLPQAGDPLDAFGLRLPPGTGATFCSEAETLAGLSVEQSHYVAIAGVKLTGSISFDCGIFRGGQLFEDAMVRGHPHRAGDFLTRADLFP